MREEVKLSLIGGSIGCKAVNNSISKDVVKVLKKLFPNVSDINPVVTHEPNFSSSNANKYVKECILKEFLNHLGDNFEKKIGLYTYVATSHREETDAPYYIPPIEDGAGI